MDERIETIPTALSAAGRRRRDAMLAELTGAMQRHHRRRHRRRRAAAHVALVLGAVGLALLARPLHPGGPAGRTPDSATPIVRTGGFPGAAGPRGPAHEIAVVATVPGAADRYRVTTTHAIERVDDEALLDALAAMERPTGLIRRGNAVRLTARVVDPPRPAEPSPRG